MSQVIHPFLFAAFPLLVLWKSNVRLVSLEQALTPLLVTVGVVAVLYTGLRWVADDRRILGIRLTIVILWFFSYGHIANVVQDLSQPRLPVDAVLGPVWTLAAAISFVLIGRIRSSGDLTRILNVVGGALVLVATVSIVAAWTTGTFITGEASPALAVDRYDQSDVAPERDIYYLIFDRYAGEESLREFLKFDNSEFLLELEQRGLLVRTESRSNYPSTAMSLASSLNMSYLDWLGDFGSALPVHEAIRNNGAGRFLKSKGYRYVQIGSWWDGTKVSDVADVTYRMESLSEYTNALYSSTVLSVGVRQGWLGKAELAIRHRDIANKQFATLFRLSKTPGPKFVFAHVLLPHPPYVFDRDGGRVTTRPGTDAERSRAYVTQLRYTNRRIIEVVDALLKTNERKPVIIIQSDEGPHPGYGGIGVKDWTKADRRDLLLKFRILNAYYLPGVDPSVVYPTISPVNSFRLVFNEYFGAHFPLLPDESFVSSKRAPYDFVSVTDQVRD